MFVAFAVQLQLAIQRQYLATGPRSWRCTDCGEVFEWREGEEAERCGQRLKEHACWTQRVDRLMQTMPEANRRELDALRQRSSFCGNCFPHRGGRRGRRRPGR